VYTGPAIPCIQWLYIYTGTAGPCILVWQDRFLIYRPPLIVLVCKRVVISAVNLRLRGVGRQKLNRHRFPHKYSLIMLSIIRSQAGSVWKALTIQFLLSGEINRWKHWMTALQTRKKCMCLIFELYWSSCMVPCNGHAYQIAENYPWWLHLPTVLHEPRPSRATPLKSHAPQMPRPSRNTPLHISTH